METQTRIPASGAFTLIELLIVVAIIAILALIAVPNFLEAQTRAKVTRAKTDMRTLTTGLEAYRLDNPDYPPDSGSHGNYEYATWKYLTTPVAYMNSILHNPYPALDQGFDRYAEAVFVYGADSRPNGNHGWPEIMWGRVTLFYWMLSAGPDMDADLSRLSGWGDGQPWY